MGVEPAILSGGVTGFEGVLDALPCPALLIDPDTWRATFANRAAQGVAGGGLRLAEPLPAVATHGERFGNVQLDLPSDAGPLTVAASGCLVALPGGRRALLLTFEDVTALAMARRQNKLLADASGLLARSLDYDDTLANVARLAVPDYADWCFVELLQADGSIVRAVAEHADPAKRDFVREYDRRYPLDPDAPVGTPQVIRTGEPHLMSDLPEAFWEQVSRDPEQLRLLREVGFRSSMIVPLRVRGQVIGALALATAESGRRYDEHDLRTAQALANRCALALDNARLFTELREAHAAADRAHQELEGIIEGVADAITAQRPDGRLVYANAAAVRLLGFESAEELLAAEPSELRERFEPRLDDGSPVPVERLPGRRAMLGERPEPLTVRYRVPRTGEERWSRVQATPVRDEAGSVRLAINVIEDITELKRGESAHRFLSEASRVLAGSLEYEETLAAVAQLAVPEIADWCAVDLADADGGRRVAVAHVDPDRVALAREVHERYPPDPDSPYGIPAVLRTGRSEIYPEITDEMLDGGARDPEHRQLLVSLGMRSVMVVPMRLRERVLGALTFVSAESGRRFDAHDLTLAEDLALRAAAAVENARLYETAASIAHTLQASLLPPVLPELPGLELAAAYHPAGDGYEVGGDFYDVFSTADDQWYAVMGDVCGKGAEAAAVTALARHTIRAAAVRRRHPSAILRWLSDAMVRHAEDEGRFCTIACVHLDLSRTPVRVTVACGGHPLPVVVRTGGATEVVGTPGTLLGLVEDPDLQDRSTELRAGDALLLYTDGLTEARAPDHIMSPDELADAAGRAADRPAPELIDRVLGEALGESSQAPRDDIAVLALRALP